MNNPRTARPQSCSIVNRINKKAYENFSTVSYENILKKFPEEMLIKAWNILCQFIYQNYLSGKGTIIKGFGTFTFTNFDVNLEGTTNQFQRDIKKRKPVFIASTELEEHLRPGQYNESNGYLIYYNQKQNNSIGHVRFNYAELAYSLNINKENCTMIIKSLFHYIADKIRSKEFKNKEMPHLGTLILQGNILGVKFLDTLKNEIQKIPEKLYQTKKNVHMYIQPDDGEKTFGVKDIENIQQTMRQLRPKSSVVTRITDGGQQWLKENLGLDLSQEFKMEEELEGCNNANFNEQEGLNINENNDEEDEGHIRFMNDTNKKQTQRLKSAKNGNNKKNSGKKLRDLNIPLIILQSIEYHKSIIIKELKSLDTYNTGGLSKIQIIRCFSKSNVHPGLSAEMINSIVKLYIKSNENIDYMRLMTLLLREIVEITGSNAQNSTQSTQTSLRSSKKNSLKSKQSKEITVNNKNLSNREKELKSIEDEIKTIKIVSEDIKIKYRAQMEQSMSADELIKIFRSYSIVYPKTKVLQILNFIEIPDTNNFTLSEFVTCLQNCKILWQEILQEDIISSFNKLKDIIYISGGKEFLFPNNKSELTEEEFVNLFLNKTKFSFQLLSAIFHYIVKNQRNFTIEDYEKFFTKDQRVFNEVFDEELIKAFNKIIVGKSLKISEYFSKCLQVNPLREGEYLTRKDFYQLCLQEKFKYNAEEIDHFFNIIDLKHDDIIDRDEFCSVIGKIYNPIYKLQDVIKKNQLDGEDLAYRMEIDMNNPNEHLDYYQFKLKIKKLDSTFSDALIQELFDEIKNTENKNTFNERQYVTTSQLMEFLNCYTKPHFRNINNKTFSNNFCETLQRMLPMVTLKNNLEKLDRNHNGRLTKADFCTVIEQYVPDYKDEDIMKFCRLKDLVSNDNLVKYPEFLDLIYYDASQDEFNSCLERLKKYIETNCNKDLNLFFQKINHEERKSIYDITKTITIEQFKDFICNCDGTNFNPKDNTICKFDLDSDGVISYEDIQGILERYQTTLFFKFKNDMNSPSNDLYADGELNEERFKEIVRLIKKNLKAKNLTEIGLFKKLDINGDGFISNYEFNEKINDVILLSPSIKDQFFNTLDYYHNGLIDLKTFLFRFKEFKSNETLVKNDCTIEKEIPDKLSDYLIKESHNYSDIEIFKLIDHDGDGVINLSDFKNFCINHLGFLQVDFNDYKLQRVLQSLSLSKNSNVTFIDFKDIYNKCVNKMEHVDFKDKFKETINQNLSVRKKNNDWINELIEKFSLFISERFTSIDEFFDNNTQRGSGKFTYENFINFHKDNYECFDKFNLTEDELLAIFTTLDSQKKNYLTIHDLKNKLSMFDFYKKMHWDIKSFINENFNNSLDAFTYFLNYKTPNYMTNDLEFFQHSFLTRKDFFTGINNFFPKKYVTETILKYMKKNFKDIDKISFSEFNYIYFDAFDFDEKYENRNLANNKKEKIKMKTEQAKNKKTYSSVLYNGNNLNEKLATPYDTDPLLKLKRILNSSPIDYKEYFLNNDKNDRDVINLYEFRNIIKGLNIGLTHIEIEEIINKVGKTRDGKINYKLFKTFILTEDKNLNENKKNISKFLSEVKKLIYKYYSTPKLAFQFNDKDRSNYLDFNEFKCLVNDLYSKEQQMPIPNFTLIKSAFDSLCLRKNGIIELREWNKAFSQYEGELDLKGVSSQKMDSLREWENSNEIQSVYNEINRNRKVLLNIARRYFIKGPVGENLIQPDNMIRALQEVLPRTNLSRTQWKMMVNLGDKNRTGLVDYELFMSIIGNSAKIGSALPPKI